MMLVSLALLSALSSVQVMGLSPPVGKLSSMTGSYDLHVANSAAISNTQFDTPPGAARYKLSGEASLRPVRISDDGTHMYLEWSEDQALPAVFALTAQGDEEMVDGYMRQGIFTIDRVHSRLVFRIDKKSARADRTTRESPKELKPSLLQPIHGKHGRSLRKLSQAVVFGYSALQQ
jgi:hypothetical protein